MRGAAKLLRYSFSRKNKYPAGEGMVMLLIEPLLVMVKLEAVQFVVLKLLFCCKAQPLDG